jgi:hypothetical protein
MVGLGRGDQFNSVISSVVDYVILTLVASSEDE